MPTLPCSRPELVISRSIRPLFPTFPPSCVPFAPHTSPFTPHTSHHLRLAAGQSAAEFSEVCLFLEFAASLILPGQRPSRDFAPCFYFRVVEVGQGGPAVTLARVVIERYPVSTMFAVVGHVGALRLTARQPNSKRDDHGRSL